MTDGGMDRQTNDNQWRAKRTDKAQLIEWQTADIIETIDIIIDYCQLLLLIITLLIVIVPLFVEPCYSTVFIIDCWMTDWIVVIDGTIDHYTDGRNQ